VSSDENNELLSPAESFTTTSGLYINKNEEASSGFVYSTCGGISYDITKNISLGVNLQNSIWVNNKGTFEKYSKEINIPNIRPGFLKGFFINGKVKFVGFGEPSNRNYTFSNIFKLYEIVLNLF
jgi:hypothetical protein